MKSKRKSGTLFALLAKNYLAFTLAMLLGAAGVYALWSRQVDKIYEGTDLDALLADPALTAGDYQALSDYLQGKDIFAVLTEQGDVVFCSSPDFDARLSASVLSCVPVYNDSAYISVDQSAAGDGSLRYYVSRVAYDENGDEISDDVMVLDGQYRVLSGGFDPGRTAYTAEEFGYLTGVLPSGYSLCRQPFAGADGTGLELLLWQAQTDYSAQFAAVQRIWLLAIPLYVVIAAAFIAWLDRRIRRPLKKLNAAVQSLRDGQPAAAGDCGGPREIRRIGESFDELSAALRESEDERRRMDAERQTMIANIAHDLKTPTTVISGYAKAICDGTAPPEKTEHYLRAIDAKAQALSELINAFSEYSKTSHPEFALSLERTDLCKFCRDYLAAKYREIDLAGFTVRVNIPETPAWCLLDGFQFGRALDNLLSNTLRYNRLGTVIFFDLLPGPKKLTLRLGDNGVGIPPDKADRIFEPFVTGDESRSAGGSGLGLSITRLLVEKHGGTVELARVPSRGRSTEFVITLPSPPPETP